MEYLLWQITAIIIRYKIYRIIIAHSATITVFILPNIFMIKGVDAPIRYAGNVTANFDLNPRQAKISYKPTHVMIANAAGKIYVSENHNIGKKIIVATIEVIILFNI